MILEKGPFDNFIYQIRFYILSLLIFLLLITSVSYVYHKNLNRALFNTMHKTQNLVKEKNNIKSMLVLERSSIQSSLKLQDVVKKSLDLKYIDKNNSEVVEISDD